MTFSVEFVIPVLCRKKSKLPLKVPYFFFAKKFTFSHFLEISSERVKILFFFPALFFFPPSENEWVSHGQTFAEKQKTKNMSKWVEKKNNEKDLKSTKSHFFGENCHSDEWVASKLFLGRAEKKKKHFSSKFFRIPPKKHDSNLAKGVRIFRILPKDMILFWQRRGVRIFMIFRVFLNGDNTILAGREGEVLSVLFQRTQFYSGGGGRGEHWNIGTIFKSFLKGTILFWRRKLEVEGDDFQDF